MNKKIIGALLVSMAANIVCADIATPANAKTEKVCQNNSCKGKADCMGFGNDSCKGANECKGNGILNAKTKAACIKKAGLWVTKK